VEKCKECGRLRDNGPTKRFRDFINDMVGSSEEDNEERQRLYRLRSALTHSGDLFDVDMEARRGMNPKATSELLSHFTATRLTRQTLLNWLTKKTGGWPKSD
jgi:hypothetical protein